MIRILTNLRSTKLYEATEALFIVEDNENKQYRGKAERIEKMKTAVKYVWDASPIYLHGKHICPECGGKTELRYVSKVVNSKSPEAKDYDFSVGDTFLAGDVEFRTRYFHCPECRRDISVQEMKESEKNK